MKKLLYMAPFGIAAKANAGIAKKVLGQVEAFRDLGYDTSLLCLKNGRPCLIEGKDETFFDCSSFCSFQRVIFLYRKARELCRERQYDVFYFRYMMCDGWLYRALRDIKATGPRMVAEIPTYPYDDENRRNRNLTTQFRFLQDRFFRTRLAGRLDRFVLYGNRHAEDTLWGVPVTRIVNAVPASSIRPISHVSHEEVNLFIVANIMHHHRFDKVLRGLAAYREQVPQDKFRLHIVGDGPDTQELKDLTKQLQLDGQVQFYGIKTGEALRQIYEQMDLGLCYFPTNTRGGKERHVDTSLKMAEYCAFGLPHTSTEINPYYPAKTSFFLPAEADEQLLEMKPIMDFARSVDWTKAQQEMTAIARQHLTWQVQMARVIESLDTRNN